MTKEMEFFLYLLENYAYSKNKNADIVLNEWDKLDITNYIFNMYPMYHTEKLENAFLDIDNKIKEKNSD